MDVLASSAETPDPVTADSQCNGQLVNLMRFRTAMEINLWACLGGGSF